MRFDTQRVGARLSERVARRLGLGELQAAAAGQVAALRDIGLISVPEWILDKRGPLTGSERELLHGHPLVGARIVRSIPGLAHLETWIRAGHERPDGRGYPDALAGADVPMIDRVAFTCAAYEAMTADRPYRAALDADAARAELRGGAGTQFCERSVRALLETLQAA
jgi:HD-GYP domain-containing protein (c-di-GMP phosphodiesterase class II)